MVYLAIYNVEKHIVEFQEKYKDDLKVGKDRLPVDNPDLELFEADLQTIRLQGEAGARGTLNGEWKLYRSDKAFSWDAVVPQGGK